MAIQDVLNGPWAIMPEKLAEIQDVYSHHLNQQLDLSTVEERLGKKLDNQRKPYRVVNGIAVLDVEGVIAKRMNLLTQISGGVSTQLLKVDFSKAVNDPTVKGIILIIDSPGGTVDGTEELANAVYEARDKKPIVAYVDGLMASAAYWIGAAADRIYINGETAMVGSIGVVATHVDYSKYEEKQGIKTSEIYAGKYKRIATEYEPLTKEGKQYLQDRVDYFYSIFVNSVSRFRGDKLKVTDTSIPWADGKVFIGKQAIENGLADGIITLKTLIARLSRGDIDTKAIKARTEKARLGSDAKSVVVKPTGKVAPVVNVTPTVPTKTNQTVPKTSAGSNMKDPLKAAWDSDARLRKEYGGSYDAFVAFKENELKGRIMICSGKVRVGG